MPVSGLKLLIGYDGSECAVAAIEDLRLAGLPGIVQAVVVSVADVWPQLPPEVLASNPAAADDCSPAVRKCRLLATRAMAEATGLAAQGAARVRSLFTDWHIEPLALGGSPYAAIVSKAEEWRPDLVVVGSHGRTATARALLGSVSQNVLSYSPCSVRVGRHRDGVTRPVGEPPRIVLGIDGSSDAALAVSAVCDRTWPAGTSVQVITSVDSRLTTAFAGLGPTLGDLREAGDLPADVAWAQRATGRAAYDLQQVGLAATPLVLFGDPRKALLDAADRWNADSIFVGAKGHSRLQRFVLGSVSAAVAARARCSVEIVRQGG